MQKQPSSIIIYKRGGSYICDAKDAYGGGYSGASAGNTVEEAALFALREEQRYIKNNPLGGEMHLPSEVREWIDESRRAQEEYARRITNVNME